MALQPSADLQRSGPLPRMISFVLFGRRTLSEHLPAETIDVSRSIAQRSRYLCKVIVEQGQTYPCTWKFSLPKIDPIGFRMYIEWLETGHIDFSNANTTASAAGLPLRDAFDLVFAHIAGTQLEEPDFQDYVIDTMNRILDVSQTPDLKVLEVVFLENGASNLLKQFIVDKMFAVERKMLGMMRGRVEDLEDEQREVGCKYHVHVASECYRPHMPGNIDNRLNLSHASHRAARSNALANQSCRPRAISPSKLWHDSLLPASPEIATYDMVDFPYFGSSEWSREVHGLQRRDAMSDLHTNKPLPNIPPLTPGSSSSPRLSPLSSPPSTSPEKNSRRSAAHSTQQLIFECLSRLPPIHDPVRTRAESEPDWHRSQIPSLVLECLERFRSFHSDGESSDTSPSTRVSSPYLPFNRDPLSVLQEQSSSPSSGTSSPYPMFEHSASPMLREQSPPWIPTSLMSKRRPSPVLPEHIPVRSSTAVFVPGPERRVRWEKSYDTLPKPSLEAEAQIGGQAEADLEDAVRHGGLDQPPPTTHAHSTSVKRKCAPPRGIDWLEQYDRINDLMRGTPTVVAKRSRRSRFKELLRSESRLGSVKVKGQ